MVKDKKEMAEVSARQSRVTVIGPIATRLVKHNGTKTVIRREKLVIRHFLRGKLRPIVATRFITAP
jgi:hypothetical protein